MPFNNRAIRPGDPFAPSDLAVIDEPPAQEKPTHGQLAVAGIQNTPTAGLMNLRRYDDVEGYEPDFSNLPPRFDPFVDDLADARSKHEFHARMSRIDSQLEAAETTRRGGAAGMFWAIATGIADPVTLPLWFLAPTKAFQGASIGKTAALASGLATADAAVSESILQSTMETRSADDAILTLGGSAVLGALVGTGGGYIAERMGRKKVDQLQSAIREELADSVRVRRAEGESESIGAGQAATTFDQESPVRAPARMTGLSTINSPLQRLLWDKVSPTAKRIVDELTPHNIIKKKHLEGIAPVNMPLQTAVEQAKDSATAAIIQGVRKARRDLAKRGIRLSEDEISIMAGKAATRGDTHTYPEITALTKTFRNSVNEWTDRAVSLGILNREDFDPTLALSYFPRVYDADAISKNYQRWRLLLANHFKATSDLSDDAEIEAVIDSLTRTIRGTPIGRMTMPGEIAGALSGSFKARTIKVPDIQLEPFLVKDIRIGLQNYMRSVAPEVLLKERYGTDNVSLVRGQVNISSVEQAIVDEYSLAINRLADSGKSVKKLEDARDQALTDVRHILNRVTGLDAPTQSNGWHAKFSRGSTETRSWIAASSLGNVTLASTVDHANVVLNNGLANVLKTRPAAWSFGKVSKTAKEDFDAFAIGLDTVLNTRMMKFADIEDIPATQTAMTYGQTRVAPAVFKYTLANRWNRSLKRGAAVAAQNRILKDVGNFGRIGRVRTARLAQAGIDQQWAARISTQYRKHGEMIKGARYANTREWDDLAAAERFEQILHREVDTTIITPQPGDTPIILDNPLGKFVTQFQKTILAGQTQVIIPLSQRMMLGDVTAINALATMVGLGMMQEYIRTLLRHDFDSRKINQEVSRLTQADWIRAGIDRSGATSFFLENFNFVDNFAEGRFSNALGLSESSRYFFRSQGFAARIPAAGYVDNIGRAIGSGLKGGEFDTSDLSTIRRLLPFQNAYYSAWLFDEVERQVAEQANLPKGERRKRKFAKRPVKF